MTMNKQVEKNSMTMNRGENNGSEKVVYIGVRKTYD
jgi:hypothetical protein